MAAKVTLRIHSETPLFLWLRNAPPTLKLRRQLKGRRQA
jgi:hypothetical protein